ncbi:vacuolar protein sorting-associated protein, putative [Pediculus humanus corporis]|uniref:Vacuolar protein sorting-associated protein, putative n=1 Tax=Pediculus humanus subsp. corporis TaxID=121224 RepID=E0VVD5_PEDHC|nr:vacuolar protein sorting-associated protein, putative [Pediculus humanus corporis]EEB17341.1 vacuolar protein sorting-associated protein, putative [Pediculus humanus corporis]
MLAALQLINIVANMYENSIFGCGKFLYKMSSIIGTDTISKMNVISVVKTYISKMIEDSGPGMKVLLLDKQTTSIISMVYSQSEIFQKEVYLFERIDVGNRKESIKHLKCIVFMRPTKENIGFLAGELKYPRYSTYYIYLSNIISKSDIKILAESDEQEVVREIQEFYADYLAVSPHLFSLGIPCIYEELSWNLNHLQRSIQGITSVLLSLKRFPIIRYQGMSEMAKRLAEGVRDVLTRESSLCNVGHHSTSTILLILDRREDPITPLLNQWTYQAMVHELLTINNNRVCLPKNQDMKEVVLSAEHDEFYCNNLYLNYGEIAQMIKELVDEFQKKAKSHKKVETIADMKNFVESYPQFSKMSGTATKHVNVVDEIFSLIGKYCLMDVSELEQDIVSQDDQSQQLQNIRGIINNNKIRDIDATRLVILYCLRYRRSGDANVNMLVNALRKRGVSDRLINMVDKIRHYSVDIKSDLFGENKTVEKIKKKLSDLKGVENVFTRHTPLLKETLEDLIKGKLKESMYPYVNSSKGQGNKKIQDVIVFMIGGTTYAESLIVHQLNRTHARVSIVLGGTTIHNSTSFLDEVEMATERSGWKSNSRIKQL